MSLENKIKEAFMRNKKLREANNWSPDTQPNIYELSNFLRKSGYRLVDVIYNKSSKIPEVFIEPITKGYLHPDISHDLEHGEFLIDIINHGLLIVSDVESIIQGYENALSVARHLNSLDLSDLEVEDEE